jgi:4-hydroxy-4-methyl-2-oxoglutarate aldolase
LPNQNEAVKYTREQAEYFSKKLGRFSTSNLSDALDRFRINGGLLGIAPVNEGVKMAGLAFTVRYLPMDQTIKRPWKTYIDQARPGDVIVVDNGGRIYCTVCDLLTRKAVKMGIAGTVIYGCCRDVDTIHRIRYPVFSKGRYMMTGKDRVEVEGFGLPITISDVLVTLGDIIIGDDNGVVCVPLRAAEKVLKAAEDIETKELGIAEAIDRGTSLSQARDEFGYGELQRAKD